MKKIAISVLLASAFAFAHAQDASSSINGTWKIHNSIAGNENDASCTFAQTNNDLAGTCPSPDGPVKLTGKVDGKKVSWSFEMQYNGSPLTMKYEGSLDAGKISGSVTVDPFGVSGDFTATLSGSPEPAAAPAAVAPAAAESSLAGKWKVHSAIAGNENDASCTFVLTNSDLAGTCTSEQSTVKVKGKIEGKKVTWSYDAEYNGNPLTVKFNGTLDSGKIAGDVNVEQFGVGGDFTATPEK